MSQRLQCIRNTSLCTNPTANPFAGAAELSGTSLFNATTSIEQSLKPFPQFSGVTKASIPSGIQSGDLLEVRANKRFSQGLLFNFSYTLGKIIMTRGFREPQYTWTYQTLADYDRTHHIAFTLRYDLPFGRGKRWAGSSSGVIEKVIGGWQYNPPLEYMTGTPTTRPDAYNFANPALPQGQQTYGRWFNTCTLLANGTRSNCASADEPVVWAQLPNA